MSKIIILQGPSRSGKTTMAAEWVREDPQHRRSAGNFAQGRAFIRQGFDVILDIEELSRNEIVVFGPEQIGYYLGTQLKAELELGELEPLVCRYCGAEMTRDVATSSWVHPPMDGRSL